jgi:hypothetical protein
MNSSMKKLLTAGVILALFTFIVPTHAVVIGNWEGTPDNCIDWGNKLSIDDASNMPSIYGYDSTVGVTNGSQSLHVIQSGYGQRLAFRLNAAERAAFMANSVFSIDVSVAASGGLYTAGYTNIEEVHMNAPGAGWTAVASGTPLQFMWWGTAGARTQPLVINYSAFRNAITTTEYIEIVITLNIAGGAPADIYFDNAQLYGGTGVLGSYAQEVSADKPALWLRFESGIRVDSSGNNYWTFAGAGATQSLNTGIGNTVSLDGTSGGCVAAANKTTDPGWSNLFADTYAFVPDDVTFEFWAKGSTMHQYGFFFHQIKTDETKAPGMGNSGGTIRILNGAGGFWYTGITTPLDNVWHHFVVTYDEQAGGVSYAMKIQLYIDGVFKASTTVGTSAIPAKLGPELDHIVIGGANDKGYVWNTFTGLVDEFAIYQGVLTADRIAIHHGAGMCAMTRGDVNGDCAVDLKDFAALASSWLLCNNPTLFRSDPECMASW